MNEQLDPQLSRLFSNYAPALESSAFLAQLQLALDRAEHRARWRMAAGWSAIAIIAGAVAFIAGGPLADLIALTDHTALSLESRLAFSLTPLWLTPLNLTLVTALVALCLHKRIRALLAL
jgi:hypothetical protein